MRTVGQRVVVITGASSGIGRETARQFAARGAAVVLAVRGEPALHATAQEVTRAGGTALVVPSDVVVWQQVQHLAQATLERFGRIDVWVNNAAVSGYGELLTLPVEAIDRILDVDLRGQVYGVKAVLPILRQQGHSTIIGVSSGLGVRAVALMVPYCIAKSGVNALYEGLRLEERHAKSGVRVTTILPASIDTPFYDSAASWMGVRPAPIPPVYQPRAVAEAIVFAADHPRRDIYIGAAAQLALLQRISPALTDRLLAVGGQVFARQQRNQPDRGQSNLTCTVARQRSRGRRGRPFRAAPQPLDPPGRLPPHPGQKRRARYRRPGLAAGLPPSAGPVRGTTAPEARSAGRW